MTVAVIQTAFPGDVVLSTPIFEALKKEKDASYVNAVVRPESACLLKNNPFVDEITPFDKYGAHRGLGGIRYIAAQIAECQRAIIVQRHLRSALTAFLAGIRERIGFSNAPVWSRLLYTHVVPYQPGKHQVRRCLSLLGLADSQADYKPRIYLDSDTINKANGLLKSAGLGSDFAVVAPGSVWPTKRYPHYPRLVDLFYERADMPVALLGSKDDMAVSHRVAESSAHKPCDLSGLTTLLESAAIISKAKMVVANDSAAAHLAAALGTPVVAVFGPTSPSLGFYPYSEKAAVAEIGKLYCRPCTSHGSKACPEKHFECMKKLDPESVYETALSLLGR